MQWCYKISLAGHNSKSISMRSYENKDSNIIEIVSDGSAEIEELFLAPMKGIY